MFIFNDEIHSQFPMCPFCSLMVDFNFPAKLQHHIKSHFTCVFKLLLQGFLSKILTLDPKFLF